MTKPGISLLFDLVDLTGVLANGILGGVLARERRFDPVGFVVLAFLSGLGGGLLRDLMLQQGFPVAVTNPAYLPMALTGAAVAYFLHVRGKWTHRALIVADALALGCWAATGTTKALTAGLQPVPAVFLGMVTAVGGGMVRDVVVGRTPAIFGGNTLYATGAFAGSVVMAILYAGGLPNAGMGASILVTATICVLARRRGWSLPDADLVRERLEAGAEGLRSLIQENAAEFRDILASLDRSVGKLPPNGSPPAPDRREPARREPDRPAPDPPAPHPHHPTHPPTTPRSTSEPEDSPRH